MSASYLQVLCNQAALTDTLLRSVTINPTSLSARL